MAERPYGENEADEGDEEEGDKDDQTDRLARDLIENTAPEPSPPPAEEGPQPQQETKLLLSDPRMDGEMALGDMITPRPTEAEHDVVEDTPAASIG